MRTKKRITNELRGLALLSVLVVFSCTPTSNENTPPNIILFLVDDMGLMDTSVPFLTTGEGDPINYPLNRFYRTPNMEKLAAQGIRFTHFYAHSVCSPTRASLLTGQNSARHQTTNWIRSEHNNRTPFGPTDWNWKGLDKRSVTLPRLFQQAGYQTIHVGKAHFGPFFSEGEDPLNLGFDVNIAGSSIGHPGSYYGEDGFGHLKGQKERAVNGLEKYHGKDVFLTEALTLEAKKGLSHAKAAGKPFFLYLAHYAVHAPFHSDPRFADHYKDSGKSKAAQAYATLVEGIDKSLGDIVQYVNDLGVGENTLILFLGDNGSDAPLPIDNHYSSSSPIKGKKGNHWEGGMRVPFIAAWASPNATVAEQKNTPIAANTIQQQFGSILDIWPTLCKAARLTPPEGTPIDGVALQQQLRGERNAQRKERFLNHFPHGNHRSNYFTSLVDAEWKIVYHYPIDNPPRYELYNLNEDPFETTNRANQNPEQLDRLMTLLRNELKDKGALYPEKEQQPLEPIRPQELITTRQ